MVENTISCTTCLIFEEWSTQYAIDVHPEDFSRESCRFDHFMYVHSVYVSQAFYVYDSTILELFADMAIHDTLASSGLSIRARE